MGWFSTVFGGGSPEEKAAKAAAKAEARARQDAERAAEKAGQMNRLFETAMGKDAANCSCDARQKAAIKLVVNGETALGREAWLSISRDHPGELALALEQVGVCYHLEKDYRAALENYEAAIRVGANADQLSDNINEARKGLASLG
jgi:tetratricopeptide (TPR) repeat protein